MSHESVANPYGLMVEIWRARRRIAVLVAAFAALAFAYVLITPSLYVAQVRLLPVSSQSLSFVADLGVAGALSSLQGAGDRSVTALAILRSREFAKRFVENQAIEAEIRNALVTNRFRWQKRLSGMPTDQVVNYFHREVMSVMEERSTGVVTVTIRWFDPERSAHWANLAAKEIDELARQKALKRIESDISSLEIELSRAEGGALRRVLANGLTTQLELAARVRSDSDYAYKVVEPAFVSDRPSIPNVPVLILAMTLLGFFIAMLSILITPDVQA